MRRIKELLVVEGKHDKDKLEKLFDCDILLTNGLGISEKELDIIKEASERNGVIVMTDPDYPGKRIRDIITAKVPNVKHVFIDRSKAIGKRNVGIEYVNDEDLLEAIEQTVSFTDKNENLSWNEYLQLGLMNNKQKRDGLSTYLKIGSCNNKRLFKYLNMLGYHYEDLRKILEENDW